MSKQNKAAFDYCADLLSLRENEQFMRALMASEAGAWVSVFDTTTREGIQPPPKGPNADINAVWLSHPVIEGDSTVVVLFYSPNTMWSTVAVYNRERLINPVR